MSRPSAALQEADAIARRARFELGREVRAARLDAATSLRTAASRVGMSHSQLGRIERGEVEQLTIEQASRACAAVGRRLYVRAVPGDDTALDAGQLALLGRLRIALPPGTPFRTEVPIPLPGDRRAWDAVIGHDPDRVAVEAESRLRNLQSLDRRIALKARDSAIERIVLLVADTRHNRHVLELHREDLRASFPLDQRAVMTALRAGRAPEASGIVVL